MLLLNKKIKNENIYNYDSDTFYPIFVLLEILDIVIENKLDTKQKTLK